MAKPFSSIKWSSRSKYPSN